MAQSTYTRAYGAPTSGQAAEYTRIESWVNGNGSDIPAGVGVTQNSTTEFSAKLPAASTDTLVGVVLNSYERDPNDLTGTNAIKSGNTMNVLAEGAIYAQVEQTVAVGDPVYCRHTTKGGNTVLGRFRKDADGVAEVHTVTPTAVNSTIYVLRVEVGGKNFEFEYLSDGSATATEICNGLRALMAADAEFTALVVASGTTTLILTAQTAGASMTVQSAGDGALTDVLSTPAAATAARVKGARWLKGAASGAAALLYFSASAEAASH